jgi:hypothetical protein
VKLEQQPAFVNGANHGQRKVYRFLLSGVQDKLRMDAAGKLKLQPAGHQLVVSGEGTFTMLEFHGI